MEFQPPRGSLLGNILLTPQEIDDLLTGTPYGTLSFFNTNGYPGCTPLNFGWEDGCFYFHSAQQGERFEALAQNPRISICVYEAAEDLEPTIVAHRSVIAYGEAELLQGDEAAHSLRAMARNGRIPHKAEPGYIAPRMPVTAVYRMRPQQLTGRVVQFGGKASAGGK